MHMHTQLESCLSPRGQGCKAALLTGGPYADSGACQRCVPSRRACSANLPSARKMLNEAPSRVVPGEMMPDKLAQAPEKLSRRNALGFSAAAAGIALAVSPPVKANLKGCVFRYDCARTSTGAVDSSTRRGSGGRELGRRKNHCPSRRRASHHRASERTQLMRGAARRDALAGR